MSRVFAYCRVSTDGQTTENQVQEIQAAGFALEPHRVVEETISGSSAAGQREGFKRLLDRLERGDVLVVTKLDRLGRDVVDVVSTVKRLAAAGVKVCCLQLGNTDLTSSTGKLTMSVLAAVAEFERDLIVERTKAGLVRAVAEGKRLGRRSTLSDKQKADVRAALDSGATVYALAKQYGTTRQTIMRVRKSLDDVEPEILRTYETLGIPRREQEMLAGVVRQGSEQEIERDDGVSGSRDA
jgi:putative DNA-invertase from lambdoid prophage Rac